MQTIATVKDVRYGRLDMNSLEEVALLIGKSFSISDPMAIARQLSVQDFHAYILSLGAWLSAAGLSVVARDERSQQLIGALIAGDFAADSPLLAEQINDKFAPIFALLQSLEDYYKRSRDINLGQYLHLYMLAVLPQHRGKGIARTLVSVALEHGARQGFGTALTEAANPISQHVFVKAGFAPRQQVSYEEFTYRGKRVFASIADSGGTTLMDKDLTRTDR